MSTFGVGDKIISVEFEVFGKVQRVYFRKHTEMEAKRLGLRGWCMNTRNNTVKGILEGPADKISQMKNWLQKVGSPSSKIERAVFTNERSLAKYSFDNFLVKK